MIKKIKIGTRASRLAIAQTFHVVQLLNKYLQSQYFCPLEYEIIKIKTTGDIINDRPLSSIGGKGLFLKEIQEHLLDNKIDMAVHSLKDMPAIMPKNLTLAAILPRDDARDVLVCSQDKKGDLRDLLRDNATISTCSHRRKTFLANINKNLVIDDIRGNIDSRIAKVDSKKVDGIVIAAAGLKRLKMENRISCYFTLDQMIPAVGQGAICVECHQDNIDIINLVSKIECWQTRRCTSLERLFLTELEGDCTMSIAAHAEMLKDDGLILRTMYGLENAMIHDHHIFPFNTNFANLKKHVKSLAQSYKESWLFR